AVAALYCHHAGDNLPGAQFVLEDLSHWHPDVWQAANTARDHEMDSLRMTAPPQPMASTPEQSGHVMVEDSSTASTVQRFSPWQKLQLFFISWSAYVTLRLLCWTLKFTFAWEEPAEVNVPGAVIHPFWHRS